MNGKMFLVADDLFNPVSNGNCPSVEPDARKIFLGVFLSVGMLVSYVPQFIRIISVLKSKRQIFRSRALKAYPSITFCLALFQ